MEFLKKLKPFDVIVISLIILALVVFGATHIFKKRETSAAQIVADTKVEIDVYIRGVVITSNNPPFEEGKETFITIRNVPYTKLRINNVNYNRKKIMLPTGTKYQVVDDLTSPFTYDFLVTLEDDAKITKDGAVVGGNKIKIGLPVTLEGEDYKLNGIVSNITLANQAAEKSKNDIFETEVNKNNDVH